MAGSPIPADWDGVTYRCCPVFWPDSPEWLDILLGQMVEPQKESYWEVGSGDALQAELDLLVAEFLTLPTFFNECGSGATMPIAFKVQIPGDQNLPIDGTYQVLVFEDSIVYELNGPGYQPVNNGHNPSLVGLNNGLWHYDTVMVLSAAQDCGLRFILSDGTQLAAARSSSGRVNLSIDYLWQGQTLYLTVQAFATGGGTAKGLEAWTHFSGHYLGEGAGVVTGEYDGQVLAGNDDAHELDNDTSFNYTAVTMRVEAHTDATQRWNAGARFQNVSVPPGATITAAYLSVVFPFTSRDSPRLTFRGENADNAENFAIQQDIFGRARTVASVDWIGDNLGAGVYVNGPDISPIIQEIVNRPGWTDGNAIVILAFGMNLIPPEASRFTPYEQSQAQVCKLHIEWQMG